MTKHASKRIESVSLNIPVPSPNKRRPLMIAAGSIGLLCLACITSLWLILPRWKSPQQLLAFGSEGTEPGQLYHPSYLGVDGQGNIYVADWDDGRINVFDPEGSFLHLISLGKGTVILGMAVAPDRTVYVSYDGVVHRLDSQGNDTELAYKDSRGDLVADITGIALGPDDSLAATDNRGDVLRFDSNGTPNLILEKAFDLPSFSSRNEIHAGDAPILSYDVPANSADTNISVAVDGTGNIYAIGWTLATVLKTGADGNSLSRFGQWASFPGGLQRGRFDFPDGLAVDSYGRIYVADTSGVQVFGPDEKYLYSIHISDGAEALALDSQGNIYIVSTLYDHQIGSLTDKVIKLAALKP